MKTKISPFLRWAGGKRWLAKRLGPILKDRLNNGRYIEPFLGSGAMFFSISPNRALLNDLNKDLINAYKMVAQHPDKIVQNIKRKSINSKTYYEVRNSRPTTELAKAVRFIYLNRTCYGGLYRENKNGTFNVPYGGGSRTPALLWEKNLVHDAAKALNRPSITMRNVDFESCLMQAKEGDIVYCDPVYSTGERNKFDRYGATIFGWRDQERLANAALDAYIRGVTVIVSNAHHKDLYELFKPTYKFKLSKSKNIGNRATNERMHNEYLFIYDPNEYYKDWASIKKKYKN